MSLSAKLEKELRGLTSATLFYGAWISGMILLKTLVLEEYHIGYSGWSKAVGGALILGKVSLVLEHVSLGAWVRSRPAWVDVLLRTLLYSLGVMVVLVIERGFEGRHEHGGFLAAVSAEAEAATVPHVLVNTICVSGALLVYNFVAVIRRHLGQGGISRVLCEPVPDQPPTPAG